MRLLLVLCMLLVTELPAPPSFGADCIEKACIDVYTQDGHIVIEGRRGSGPKSTHLILPKSPSKPTKKASPKPRPSQSGARKRSLPKPRATVRKKKIATESAQSLQDKLIESLPTGGISYQPSFQPLVQTPVYFWSDIPTIVTKKIKIVGEVVEVQLRPTFIWHYGDGVLFITQKTGAPFPEGEIRHTYSKPGHYAVELITRWDGSFSIAGVRKTIPGEITTVSVLPITIAQAPIRFMN